MQAANTAGMIATQTTPNKMEVLKMLGDMMHTDPSFLKDLTALIGAENNKQTSQPHLSKVTGQPHKEIQAQKHDHPTPNTQPQTKDNSALTQVAQEEQPTEDEME